MSEKDTEMETYLEGYALIMQEGATGEASRSFHGQMQVYQYVGFNSFKPQRTRNA